MRKIALVLIMCVLLSGFQTVFAQDREVTVKINGQPIPTPVPARIVAGRTVLPMRVVFERLGAVVTWVEADKLIFATKGNTLLVMQPGNYSIAVQKTDTREKQMVQLDVAPFVDNGHTLIPVRAVAETLEAEVLWDESTYTVNIYK